MSITSLEELWLLIDVDGNATTRQLFVCMLQELAKDHGEISMLLDKAEPLHSDYKAKRGSYDVYINMLVREFFDKRMYAGMPEADIIRASDAAGTFCRQRMYVLMRALLTAAKELKYRIAAISGSPRFAVETFLGPFDVDAIFATEFPVDANRILTDEPVKEFVTNKALPLKLLKEQFPSFDPKTAIGMGDTNSDVPVLQEVGWPVPFNPKGKLRQVADEQKWPKVLETQDTHYAMVMDPDGVRRVIKGWRGIFPPALADRVKELLTEAGW